MLKTGFNILKKESQQPISQVSAKTKYTLGEILQDQGLPTKHWSIMLSLG
jgi:hypothetical protein